MSKAAEVTSSLPPGLQHARHLAPGRPLDLVGQAVEHVERGDDVEAGVGERDRPDAGARDPRRRHVILAKSQAAGGQVEAEGAAVARQHRQVGAGAAAAVEQPQIGAAAGGIGQPRRDEAAKASEPEVRAFGAVGELEQAVHAARATRRGAARGGRHGTIRARMRHRGLTEAAAVLAGAFVLTAALTYPLVPQLDRVGRVNTDDGRWSMWIVAWVADALIVNPRGLYDANIFYPARNTLAYSEANIGAGLLARAGLGPHRQSVSSPTTPSSSSRFVLAVAGAYYLVRYLSGSREAAAVAGVLFGFCPFIFARTAHIQLLLTAGLPFSMLAFHRLVDRPSAGRARGARRGALCAQALSCAYYGIFAGLMVGLGTLFFAVTPRAVALAALLGPDRRWPPPSRSA